jgi:hypothetical protein
MPKIEILVNKFDSFDLEPPPPPGMGKRGFFSNDLRRTVMTTGRREMAGTTCRRTRHGGSQAHIPGR